MRLKVFTLRMDPNDRALDTREMDAFLEDKKVWSFVERFVLLHEKEPVWLFGVLYEDLSEVERYAPRARPGGRPGPPSVGPASGPSAERLKVNERDRPLYDMLRKWRNERATGIGTPPYMLFSNRQILTIAEHRPTTSTALLELKGIGEARVASYAQEILELIKNAGALPDGT